MGEVLPWLIVGWLILGRQRAPASASSTSKLVPSTPARVAYLYQLPGDGYETVRVAVSPGQPVEDALDQARPSEVGIFANEAQALALLVHPKGWMLAWPGVKQLQDRP